MKTEAKRKKDLGIFYTDERIVDFIFNILLLWKERENIESQRWHFSSGKRKFPSVIDPACGEGGFLKVALKKNFTKPKYVWGIDIDEEAKKKWEVISLLKSFGSEAELDNHFIHQNGLSSLPEKRFRYKKRGLEEFDCVVGNPPYGGIGIKLKGKKLSQGIQNLLDNLQKYEIFSYRKFRNLKNNKEDMLFKLKERSTRFPLTEVAKMAESMPIEILFIERFIQLTKPGGYIAIIIPDGILANANLDYVRRFIADNTKVEAIVSLPRDAFKNVGTSAKTSILFLIKPKDNKRIQNLDYPVYLANVEGNIEGLEKVFEHYKEVNPVNPKQNVVKDKTVNFKFPDGGIVEVWVTKSARDLVEEKPNSRWDPHHWQPKYDYLDRLLKKWNGESLEKIEGRNCVISGDHVRPSKGEQKGYKLRTGIEYYETKNFLFAGYDYSIIKECSKNAYERLKYTAVKQHDILISCAGVGGVGKARSSLITHKPKTKSCTGDVFIVRLKHINPFFLYVFLNSQIGKDQIMRKKSGVGTENINSNETLSLKIPILPESIQSHIESEYRNLLIYHDRAMKAKSKGDESNFKKNIETAEKMLKELISKTEDVIRGKRQDVV